MGSDIQAIRSRMKATLCEEICRRKLAAQETMSGKELTEFDREIDSVAADIVAELHADDATPDSLAGFDWWTLLPSPQERRHE